MQTVRWEWRSPQSVEVKGEVEQVWWETWLGDWRSRVDDWWAGLAPVQQSQAVSCWAALALHLAGRLDWVIRLKAMPPVGEGFSSSPPAAKGPAMSTQCETVMGKEGLDKLDLPDFPEMPNKFQASKRDAKRGVKRGAKRDVKRGLKRDEFLSRAPLARPEHAPNTPVSHASNGPFGNRRCILSPVGLCLGAAGGDATFTPTTPKHSSGRVWPCAFTCRAGPYSKRCFIPDALDTRT